MSSILRLAADMFSESWPSAPTWNVDSDMPDLSGKVVLVTGANTGIGKETARALYAHNAKVYIACRNRSKAEEAIADIRGSTSTVHGQLFILQLDLSDLHSIKRAAEEFHSKEGKLDVLFNNAGVMRSPTEMVTKQGYDLQWGTNVLGHWYFTKLLVPSLLATDEPRVVHTASLASRGGVIQFDTMSGKDTARSTKSPAWLYNQSKLGNVIVAREFAQRYPGIVSTSLNPGNIRTELTRHVNAPEWFLNAFRQLLLYPVEFGAITQLYAGTAPEAKDLNGQYLVPWARLAKPNPLVHDAELCARVWDWCEDQVKDL